MAGDKYVTLSSSLAVYATLMGYVSKLLDGPEAQSSPSLKNGLTACYQKLEKFFDKSTFDTEYYYFAMSEHPRLLLSRRSAYPNRKSLTHGIRIHFLEGIQIFSPKSGSWTVTIHSLRS